MCSHRLVHGVWSVTDRIALYRMAVAKEKARAHRRKVLANKESVSTKLVEPVATSASPIREKIKVKSSVRSALIPGEGQSMGMDID